MGVGLDAVSVVDDVAARDNLHNRDHCRHGRTPSMVAVATTTKAIWCIVNYGYLTVSHTHWRRRYVSRPTRVLPLVRFVQRPLVGVHDGT